MALAQPIIHLFYLPPNARDQGIISDLFPGVVLPKPDYEVFMKVLEKNIEKMKLQPVPWFIGKIIQVGSLNSPFAKVGN